MGGVQVVEGWGSRGGGRGRGTRWENRGCCRGVSMGWGEYRGVVL